jgi:hypothetical protein
MVSELQSNLSTYYKIKIWSNKTNMNYDMYIKYLQYN